MSKEEVKELRASLGLTQAEFCKRFMINPATLVGWEQGNRAARGASAIYLKLISSDPELLSRMVGELRPRAAGLRRVVL